MIAPVVTKTSQPNGPCSGVASLTISGTNFGVVDMTPSGYIGNSQCTSVSWVSESGLVCGFPSGEGILIFGNRFIVSSLTGTIDSSFSYDGFYY